MPLLGVIICSTRPGRAGPVFANWFADIAAAHGGFEVKIIDLAEVGLPLFDEGKLPQLQDYEHAHTRKWSQTISELDAVMFVTPEYNFGPPAPLVNALTYLVREWAYMPVGFLGYSLGVTAAARAIQTIRLTVNALRMMAIPESVLFPAYQQTLTETGELNAQPASEKAASVVLDELLRWTKALSGLRAKALKR